MALTQTQIDALPDRFAGHFEQLEKEAIEKIAEHINDIGQLTPSDIHRIDELRRIGFNLYDLRKSLEVLTNNSYDKIYKIFEKASEYEYINQMNVLGGEADSFRGNERLHELIKSMARVTFSEFTNMSKTTAIGLVGMDGVTRPADTTYPRIIDYAIMQVKNGQTDFNMAMRQAIRKLADEGVKVIYPSGYSKRLDSAVRMNLLGGLARLSHAQAEIIGEQFGADGFEISWHAGHRPTHDWGGEQFTAEKYYKEILPQMEEPNCYHRSFPIIMGLSTPTYSKEELKALEAKEQELHYFEGKGYTAYEAQQRQRRYEAAIRREKDRAAAFKAAGDDKAAQNARIKGRMLNNSYKDFSEAVGLRVKTERTRGTAKNNSVQTSTGRGIISAGSGIMNMLPRADEAVIPIKKFTEYALDPAKDYDKALAFNLALGYNTSNANKLIENIRNNITNFECKEKSDLGHGKRYEVIMSLIGENGKTANVLTAWIDDNKNGEMRLINAHVDKKKGGR